MKTILIRSCLLAGLACAMSCSFMKETAPQEPAATPSNQAEQAPLGPVPLPVRPVATAPSPVEDTEDSAAPPSVLPGDLRPGLRTPQLPDTLLYDLDGKLISPDSSSTHSLPTS